MENLPIATTPALPPSGKANTTSTATDAVAPDAQNDGNFDAALQRELKREPAAPSSRATGKTADSEAEEDVRPLDATLPATSSDTVMALLTAPAMAASQPEHMVVQSTAAAQPTQEIKGIQAVQTALIAAPGIDPTKTAASAQPSPSREHAGLPEAAADKSLPAAGHEANFAASGKTLTALAAASDQVLRPTPSEIKQLVSADGTPSVQANALTAMTGHATAYSAAAETASAQELKIIPQVGATGWDGAVAQKVVWLAGERRQVAELHLNPPHLGPLEVRVSVAQDQSTIANAQFSSPHAAVREAIEAAMPRLREILAESGITLGNTTVGNESFRQQQQQQSFTPADGSAAAWREEAGTGTSSPAGSIIGVTRVMRNGLVDIFA